MLVAALVVLLVEDLPDDVLVILLLTGATGGHDTKSNAGSRAEQDVWIQTFAEGEKVLQAQRHVKSPIVQEGHSTNAVAMHAWAQIGSFPSSAVSSPSE